MADENGPELADAARGRIFRVTCYGDTASEVEGAALAAAQEFFGGAVPLEVVQDYMAGYAASGDPKSGGRKYTAAVSVRALAQP